ncbi:hypothetical protein [Parapedobacter sp. DT-150]|uniref:hypothetical protein n=1 Tax=Parapedobacter sp. DT-150 TaxID=3396162 RepID=UPI003F53FF9E
MNRSILALLCAITLISACNRAHQADAEKRGARDLFPITKDPEKPTSIVLRLLDMKESGASVSYVAKGIYQEDTVGFVIEIDKIIPAGINSDGSVNEEIGFKKGTIKFIKSGVASDRFVSALGELWQVDGVDSMKTQPVEPLVFSSNNDAVDYSKPATGNFKLFFGEDAPVPGELFFTLDSYKRIIEFREKGAQYRSQIVHAFAE